MIQYLYSMKEKALRYEDDDNKTRSFIYTSNALFADDILDRKNSQGYIMLLFDEAIAWKVNKQNIIIMLSIKVKLLALLQITKEAIFTS